MAYDPNNKPRIKNPSMMVTMYGAVIAVVLYMLWQIISAYRAGGEEAPTLTVLIVACVLLGGGCVFIACLAVRLWKQAKEDAQDPPRTDERDTLPPKDGE